MDGATFLKWLNGTIPPAVFLLTIWALLEPKYARKVTGAVSAGFLAVILVMQGVVLAVGQSPEPVFTLLPVTFYLPAIVWLHLLSKRSFLPTALIWLVALLGNHLILALQKLLTAMHSVLGGPVWDWVFAAVLALAAGLLLLLVFRVLRRRFMVCVEGMEGGWFSLVPLPLMLLALYSYFLSSTTDVTVLFLLVLTAVAAFGVLLRLMDSLAEVRQAEETSRQMETLRQSYEVLRKKLALGRSYRHDMRHHMNALSALLRQGEANKALEYVSNWQGQFRQIEAENWCKNAAVNAVLSAYLAQAKEVGCAVEADISLPGELPFEETDLCVVLANALENAIHACEQLPEDAPRNICLGISLTDHRRLTIRVENPCRETVAFDEAGLPIVPPRTGHGQGLKSIAAVAEKYHGLLQCDCAEGTFTLRAVLLDGTPEKKPSHQLGTVLAGVFLCLFLINCMPAFAQALETVPVLGSVIRVVDLRTYSLGWGDTNISVQEPVLEGNDPEAAEMTDQKDAFVAQMEELFLRYVAQKHRGYAAMDLDHEVVRDDDALFVLRFNATLNVGGSLDVSRYLTLDKTTGQVLTLADLFAPDVNYVFPVSREIKAQMAEQINAGEGNYFLPGGIWPDEDCFQSIDPEQNFYINDNGQLVIAFGEYEVAPGSMGAPEFVIPTDVLDGLLAQPTVLT